MPIPDTLAALAADLDASAAELAELGKWPEYLLVGFRAALERAADPDLLPDPEGEDSASVYLANLASALAQVAPEEPAPLWPELMSLVGDLAVQARQATVQAARSAWDRIWTAFKADLHKAVTEASAAADNAAEDLGIPKPTDWPRIIGSVIPAGAGLYLGTILPSPIGPLAALAGLLYGGARWVRSRSS